MQAEEAPTAEGFIQRRVRLRGIDFHWLEWGDAGAPPVVLLHGLTGHARTWDHVAPVLAGRHHLFVPDQRGHGETGHADSYSTRDFVDDLAALVEHWGVGRFPLVGLSMGGHNAMAFTAAHPEHVSRLAIIDIPAKIDRRRAPNWEAISRLAETGHRVYPTFDEAYADARLANTTAPDEYLRYRTKHNLLDVDGGFMLKYDHRAPAWWAPEDLTERVTSIDVPVLLVRGRLSTVLTRAEAERTIALFPHGELVEVDDSGHSVPTDRPEKLAPILSDWLAPAR